MNERLLRLLRDFFYAYGKSKSAPYDWSFDEQETCEKLQIELQRHIDNIGEGAMVHD